MTGQTAKETAADSPATLQHTGRRRKLRPAFLALFVLLQTIAAVFFLGDALSDITIDPTDPHTLFEAMVAIALVAGVVFGTRELHVAMDRLRQQGQALAAASGALATVISAEFDAWALTPAQRDVALLALKGLDVAEIATLRGAAQGTVRAQLSQIYAKAGVTGRAQFAAIFVEELLAGPLDIAPEATQG